MNEDTGDELMADVAGARGDAENSSDQFDISLPPTHSYLSTNMVAVPGRSVLQPGWSGQLPCVGHHSVIYPGETIPMVLSDPADCNMINAAISNNGLFGLLFPEHTKPNSPPSGYGVLCEVFETTQAPHPFALKAKVSQRFRYKLMPNKNIGEGALDFYRLKVMDVIILPEVYLGDMLANSRLLALDRLRHTNRKDLRERIKTTDTLVTNWAQPLVKSCNVEHLANIIKRYFSTLKYSTLPVDAISLSFWAASNLPLSYKDRLRIFKEDNAVQRLRIEANFVDKHYILCCHGCGEQRKTEIAREENVFAMSTEGMKSNFCNLGGYVHDIMTVSSITNVILSGPPSDEYSWFPGYLWTIILCQNCDTHIGWRFQSAKPLIQPQVFYAICRNNVFPYRVSDGKEPG